MKNSLETYRYELDKSSRKFRCPSCGKKRFVRYIDRQEEKYLPEKYGRCDREVKCGYFCNPYEDEFGSSGEDWRQPISQKPKQVKHIPLKLFQRSKSNYGRNSFVKYLLTLFDKSTVKELIQKYHIGTSSKIKGGCIFYQIDIEGNIRRGKIMVYDSSGHKQRFGSVHSQLEWSDYLPEWRYFGEHLLTDDKSIPVAIVESEKTAIISSVYFPEFTWLATGTKSTLKAEYAHCLMGRNVTLFPDVGAYGEWSQKADELSYFCDISVSELLEHTAGVQAQAEGYDLADYLTRFHVNEFHPARNHVPARDKPLEQEYEAGKNRSSQNNAPYGHNPYTGEIFDERGYPASWDEVTLHEDSELQELCKRDPIVQKMIELFDGEVTTATDLIPN